MRKLFVLFLLLGTPLLADEHVLTSHEKAARHLVQVVGGANTAIAAADAMMGVIRGNPELAPYEDVFRAWYRKIFAEGDLEGELAAVYMKYFSEQELNDLAAFYASPLGQKTLTALPQIMKEGADLGMRRAKEHESELRDMIAAAKAEREKKDNR